MPLLDDFKLCRDTFLHCPHPAGSCRLPDVVLDIYTNMPLHQIIAVSWSRYRSVRLFCQESLYLLVDVLSGVAQLLVENLVGS